MQKKIIYGMMFVGSMLGSFIPLLWGASTFSFSSLLFSGAGALFGIWFGYKLAKSL